MERKERVDSGWKRGIKGVEAGGIEGMEEGWLLIMGEYICTMIKSSLFLGIKKD